MSNHLYPTRNIISTETLICGFLHVVVMSKGVTFGEIVSLSMDEKKYSLTEKLLTTRVYNSPASDCNVSLKLQETRKWGPGTGVTKIINLLSCEAYISISHSQVCGENFTI